MRRTVHISGQIEPFFGTLDENVRLLEDVLHVRTHLSDTRLTIEGDEDNVDQAAKIVEEYNHLTKGGRKFSSTEVKSLMRMAMDVPHESPRGAFERRARVRLARSRLRRKMPARSATWKRLKSTT